MSKRFGDARAALRERKRGTTIRLDRGRPRGVYARGADLGCRHPVASKLDANSEPGGFHECVPCWRMPSRRLVLGPHVVHLVLTHPRTDPSLAAALDRKRTPGTTRTRRG